MNPILDQALVALLILGAAGYFLVRHFRRRSGNCGGGCGCSAEKRVPGGK